MKKNSTLNRRKFIVGTGVAALASVPVMKTLQSHSAALRLEARPGPLGEGVPRSLRFKKMAPGLGFATLKMGQTVKV